MPKSKTNYPEIDEIRHDLDSLKNNVVELTKHIRHDGAQQTKALKEVAADRLETMKSAGEESLKKVEKQVKAKPAESLAIAFVSGLALSFLLGRR